ncbi:LacI family transcriptional regulator [Vibrio kyushuensis]|uniref:LacI family DNA-binding transcriptional regulator n=1 Tax=Vibrio kyushuensis TaxID=2910249 RepID=UPI003D0ABC34
MTFTNLKQSMKSNDKPMATIKDVAKAAGVSTATVSRALFDSEKVTESTREKVAKAVADIGYSPNVAARHLRRRETNSIMVILPDISNSFFSDVISGVEKVARTAGYKVLLGDLSHDTNRAKDFFDLVPTNQSDGLILLTSDIEHALLKDRQIGSGFPVVMACEYVEDMSLPTVRIDNQSAAGKAIEYLISLGHQNIATVTGPMQNPICRDRQEGLLEQLKKNGLPFQYSNMREGDFSFASGYEHGRTLLEQQDRPTAIFCHNDEMAIGVIKAARDLDIIVPAELSVIGFDNIAFGEYCEPELTTVNQPREDIGKQAMKTLLNILGDKDASLLHTPRTDLIVRGSTGICPKR